MKVLFAPDWRAGNPYQALLADALADEGVRVEFLSHYRRVLPLTRGSAAHRADLLHLHWPDAYFPRFGDGLDLFRRMRFPLDLKLALARMRLVYTAHNSLPHGRGEEWLVPALQRCVLRNSAAILVHSSAAEDELRSRAPRPGTLIETVPHGDLSVTLGLPVDRQAARRTLGWGDQPLCLMFGAVEPYKGIEELLDFWRERRPAARLAVIGKPGSAAHGETIRRRAAGSPLIHLQLERVPDEQLRLWLSAADCVLFNYRAILTSGAACLARSWGVPILIPHRLRTIDLDEPNPRVIRFEELATDFPVRLEQALSITPSFTAAKDWREATSWARVARKTAEVYRAVLASESVSKVRPVAPASRS